MPVDEISRSMATYMVPLTEHWLNPTVILRGATPKAWSTLEVEKPRDRGLALFFGLLLNGTVQT
jgi:hypothetical protein